MAFSKIDFMGRHSLSLISQKSRNSDAFRRIGKRYELPGCVDLFESFRRSRSGGQRARGSVRRCKVSVQILSLKNEISGAAYYSTTENIRSVQRYSNIREYSNNSFQP